MKSLGLVCCWVSKLSTGVLFLQQAADDGGSFVCQTSIRLWS